MGNRTTLLLTAQLIAAAAAVQAQPARSSESGTGSVDVGVRASSVDGDSARFQRFRDMSEGAIVERVRYDLERDGWILAADADHVGRRDQRYSLDVQRPGKLKVSFAWDQVPLFISGDTRTLFEAEAPGVFRIDDVIQAAGSVGAWVPGAVPVELRSRRDTAAFGLTYSATRELDLLFNLKTTRREGTHPWGQSFGHGILVELPAPIDTRTTDVGGGLEWGNARGSVRVGYDGSLFNNRVPILIWDNPQRLVDAAAGSSQGRSAFWPDSSAHALTTGGAIALPARSRLTGTVTVGTWRQDEILAPFTINSVLAAPALPRQTADVKARTLAMNYSVTSRPARRLWLNARYRYYDFDNRTPPFEMESRVAYDQVLGAAHGPEPLSATRGRLDLDASFTPAAFSALRVGYSREQVDRTHRIFAQTVDHVVRTSIDSSLTPLVTVRGIFEHGQRTGSGFDESVLTAVAEQPAMRHYDIADRDRNRVTALVQVTPVPAVGLTASVARGRDEYKNSGFGLRDSETTSYSLSVDVVPGERVNGGVAFVYDTMNALQNSRQANPGVQFTDPTRDWAVDSNDRTRTLTATLELARLAPSTDVRFAYDLTRSRATYLYILPPGSTLETPVFPAQLPAVINDRDSATIDVRYFFTPRVALGAMYWFDRYDVDDFALGPEVLDRIDIGNALFLGSLYRPYTAHTVSARITYQW